MLTLLIQRKIVFTVRFLEINQYHKGVNGTGQLIEMKCIQIDRVSSSVVSRDGKKEVDIPKKYGGINENHSEKNKIQRSFDAHH